jgi:hypothetical protein
VSLGAKPPKRGAADQEALDVEGVLGSGVRGEKALG